MKRKSAIDLTRGKREKGEENDCISAAAMEGKCVVGVGEKERRERRREG